MPRRNFTAKVREERFLHAGKRCEGILDSGQRCNADIEFKPWECDHNIPDRAGGKPTFENARALCKACHTAKYPLDRKIIDKVKRVGAAHAGIKRIGPTPKIQGAPLPTTARAAATAARGHRPPVERKRPLYADKPSRSQPPAPLRLTDQRR